MKALPDDVIQKYEERLAEENLNKAAMPDLVRYRCQRLNDAGKFCEVKVWVHACVCMCLLLGN